MALGVFLWYAYNVWTRKAHASTGATWVMWVVLDSLLLATTIANNEPGYLPGAWVLGSTSVAIALFVRGKWIWSYKETICAIGAIISAYIWFRYGALIGLMGSITAMNIAGIPNFIDLWRNPIKDTWPVWGFSALSCLLTLIGSDWSLGGIINAVNGIFFNTILLIIVLFKKP